MSSKLPKITLYGDYFCAPTRAVFNFLDINKIPYTLKETLLAKGDHKKEEFLKINPYGYIPAITVEEENDTFHLYESVTILRYLSQRFNTPSHYYPLDDLKRQAIINLYNDRMPSNITNIIYGTIFPRLQDFYLKLTGVKIPVSEDKSDKIPALLTTINDSLKERDYIIDDKITISDLVLSNILLSYIVFLDESFKDYPNLDKYLQRVLSIPEIKFAQDKFAKQYAGYKEIVDKK